MIPDYAVGSTVDFKFTTRAFATGIPTTASGLTVAAYPDNSTTEITAGITTTFSSGFDSRAGLVNVRVVATTGNGYASGSTYHLVVTAGTVDSVSIVGEVVGAFSLGRSSIGQINGSSTAAVNLALSTGAMEPFACEGTPTTTVIQTDLAETQNDQYIGRTVLFLDGNAVGAAGSIEDYDGSSGTITLAAAIAVAPSASDTGIIV